VKDAVVSTDVIALTTVALTDDVTDAAAVAVNNTKNGGQPFFSPRKFAEIHCGSSYSASRFFCGNFACVKKSGARPAKTERK